MDIVYHYPPELLSLMTDAIPRLCRSKEDVLSFFRSAGVEHKHLSDLARQLREDREGLSTFKIARVVLERLNEAGETTLRERRELLRRIVEFDDFTACWPNYRVEAKGFVSSIRDLVGKKDSFTRMAQEREAERRKAMAASDQKAKRIQSHKRSIKAIRGDLASLFAETNHQKRGKALEGILSRLFGAFDILIREPFEVTGSKSQGVSEQVDGAIELRGKLFLVEVKWLAGPMGKAAASEHLVRVYHRPEAHAIFVAVNGYTDPAIEICREAIIKGRVVALCNLVDIIRILEEEEDLKEFLENKVDTVELTKKPTA